MARAPRVRLSITALVPGGDGVAHITFEGERRAVFAARTAPGDVVEASVDFTRRPARATELRVLEPSPQRQAPPCPHAVECGGCDAMHLHPAARALARRGLVDDTVLRILGGLGDARVTFHEAPEPSGYRTRARLALHAARRVVVGMRANRRERVVDIATCLVLDPRLDPVVGVLRDALVGSRGDGEASVALGQGGVPVASISFRGELAASTFGFLERAVTEGRLCGASILLDGARAPAVIGNPGVVTSGGDGQPLLVPPGGFAQANPAVSAELARAVEGAARPAGRGVLELFAGAGNLTVLLAQRASSYIAVESDPQSLEALRDNLRRRGIGGAKLALSDAEAFEIPRSVEVVVLDPPRTGAPRATEAICASRVREVVYVSCDATTLARDAAKLAGAGFSAVSLDAFDMFPQTSQVEIVLTMARRA